MGGHTTIANSATRIEALRLQSSAYGVVVPWVWGTTRVAGNLLWYANFKAVAHTTEESQGGKGGHVTQQNTTFTYSASIIMGLGSSPAAVRTVWRGKTKYLDYNAFATVGSIEGSNFPAQLSVLAGQGGANYAVGDVLTVQGGSATIPAQVAVTAVGNGGALAAVSVIGAGQYTVLPRSPFATTSNSAGQGGMLTAPDESGLPTMDQLRLSELNPGRPWPYLTEHYPAQAVPYSNLCCVAAIDYALSDQAALEDHNFEIVSRGATYTPRPQPASDADPALILADLLTDAVQGAAYPAARLADLADYSAYCKAAGLVLSPALTEQQGAADAVALLLQLTNSAAVYAGGVLKIVPYGDTDLAAHGASWRAPVVPDYDLDDEDFVVEAGEEPVKLTRRAQADTSNHVKLEYYNRGNDYATEIAEAKDQADIETHGLRTQDTLSAHWICDPEVARQVAQLVLQRALYIRNTYEFRLSWAHALIEPMDLVTLTDAGLGLARTPVRVVSVEEDESGTLTVTAEDYPAGVASAARYPSARGGVTARMNFNSAPGVVQDPLIFMPSAVQTGGALQIWVAVAGQGAQWGGCSVWVSTDDLSYRRVSTQRGGARYGSVSAASEDSLTVVLHSGQLLSTTAQDAALGATLCWVGGEFLSYTTATLVAANTYTLSGLVREQYGTARRTHAAGEGFVRVDDAIVKSDALDATLIGKTLYLKFTSFTVFGTAEQSLAEVRAYPFKLGALADTPRTPGGGADATVADGASVHFDDHGNVAITYAQTSDPTIDTWELRQGQTFDTGTLVATSGGDPFTLPVASVIGNVYWIAPRYLSGIYGSSPLRVAFDGNPLASLSGVSVKVQGEALIFTWAPVSGATRYVTYWEDNGVTLVRTVTDAQINTQIPRAPTRAGTGTGLLRVVAGNDAGQFSPPYDQPVSLTGVYFLNEVANIPLDFSTGQFVGIAEVSSTHLERVSALGPASVSFPTTNINDVSLYSLGYNLAAVAGGQLAATPGAWFRNGFWRQSESRYESLPVDLGAVFSGRLKLGLTKTVTYNGAGPGTAYAGVRGEYLADALGSDITDTQAFLSAQFYVSTDGANWSPAADGDWCTARYVRITVQAEKVSALTQVDITAGTLYLDVPDKTQSGTQAGVSAAAPANVTLTDWHHLDSVLLTPHANCKTWATAISATGFTLNTDSASAVSVDYFVKGY